MVRTLKYNPKLDIRNTDSLPHGTGAKYLEVMESHIPETYIAVQWRNSYTGIPEDHIIVTFKH